MSDSEIAAELRALREEVARLRASRQRHHWLAKLVNGLEEDPRVQARVHLIGACFWLANFLPINVLLYFMIFGGSHLVTVLTAVMLGINTNYSLYANLSTDYDGLSSSQASLHARNAEKANAREDAPE